MSDPKRHKRKKPKKPTVAWVTQELMLLAETTRPFDDDDQKCIPKMDRNDVAAVAEHRKTLAMLLDIAQSDQIKRLVEANEALLAEMEILEASSEGHAQRANATQPPPTATH